MTMTVEFPAYVCSHVFEKRRPVLLVARTDGDWQLLCGGSHDSDELPRVVGFGHLLTDDPSLRAVLELPENWSAERESLEAQWKIGPA